VFTKTAGVWKQTAELTGSDSVALDAFGDSVAISGSTAIVGAWGHANIAGRAYVFTKTAGVWKQRAELKGSDTVADDLFGSSVAISGTTAVVGAPSHGDYAGRAYVFTKTAGIWKQVAELKGSDTVADDVFGNSVAILGTTVVVGADGYANNAGRAYVFTKTATGWKQTAELKGLDTLAQDAFGADVAISPSTVVVGAEGHANNAGRAYVFSEAAGIWQQTAELKGSDTTAGDWLGVSVAISGTTAVVGAYRTADKAGTAYVFTKTAGVWKQMAELKGSTGDWFGDSVAISGTTAVVGAFFAAFKVGRAYVFEA
jgi:drug/metabolite transporter superfamily protein YnfA